MGYLFKGVCYPSLEQARGEYCSQSFPYFFTNDGGSYSLECSSGINYNDNQALLTKMNLDTGKSINYSVAWPNMPECEYTGGASIMSDYFPVFMLLFLTIFGYKQIMALFNTSDKGE